MEHGAFCSTGTTVGRANGYNIDVVTEAFPHFMERGLISGAELMMIPVFYDRMKEVAQEWLRAGLRFPVIHCEKEIGTQLSDAGKSFAAGDGDSGHALYRRALDDFRRNCEMAAMAGCEKMVFHLWGGLTSDSYASYNISVLPELLDIIRPYRVRLLIENVPCTTKDPLSQWQALAGHLGSCGLIFDTRFGFFHRQTQAIWNDETVVPHIEHIHISDIRGEERDFSALRPIYHPGEGMVDFLAVANCLMQADYRGTFTLESPVIRPDGADIPKLAESLQFLHRMIRGSRRDA
jgi:sugar phosphate isomerase/epimerase